MSDESVMLDTPEGIAFFQLARTKAIVGLELHGTSVSKGPTGYSQAKKRYGLKGNRKSVYDQLCKMVEDAIRKEGSR
jgi:hypothetical protein